MVEQLKQVFCTALSENNIDLRDTKNFAEAFPQVFLRTSNIKRIYYQGVSAINVSFTLDLFSKYSGEKEILDLEHQISTIARNLVDTNDFIMGMGLRSCLIQDDDSTGINMKHGILIYDFVLAEVLE